MRKVLLVLFHALPLVPLVFGRWYAAAAALLVVALPYIKAKKLAVKIETVEGHPPSVRRTEELASLRGLQGFWKGLTFLP